MEKTLLTFDSKDIHRIKEAAFGHIHDTFPKNLDAKDVQVLLICKGFLDYLGYQGIKLPVKIEYEWEKHNR